MATQMGMRATELGASLATYDSTRGTVTKDGYTSIDGVKYSNVAVDRNGRVSDFKTAEGTLDQLLRGLANSKDPSLAKLGASLQFLKSGLGEKGGGVSATITKGENGYTVKFNMGDAGTRGEQSIIIGKDGRFIKGSINTADGNSISITDDGKVLINGKDATTDLISAQKAFEDLKTVTLGHNLAKKLRLQVSDAEARLIGNIASKSHNFQEFVRNLTDLLTSYTHKDGKGQKHEAGGSHTDSSSAGFMADLGTLISVVKMILSRGKGGGGGKDLRDLIMQMIEDERYEGKSETRYN
jgi:hypothetical protein